MRWVPRSWTAFCLGRRPPRLLFGNQARARQCRAYTHLAWSDQFGPGPIGEFGSWQISWPPFFAFTLRPSMKELAKPNPKASHFHIGLRWDDVQGYYVLSIMLRKYDANGDTDTRPPWQKAAL